MASPRAKSGTQSSTSSPATAKHVPQLRQRRPLGERLLSQDEEHDRLPSRPRLAVSDRNLVLNILWG
jgi:hypothetical protein